MKAAGSDRLVPIHIDLTDAGSIEAAGERIDSELEGRGLEGLVCNAGIAA